MNRLLIILVLLIMSVSLFAQKQVGYNDREIAYARPGDFVITGSKQRITLNLDHINYSRRQMGLSSLTSGSAQSETNTASNNNRTNVSSSNNPSSTIPIIIVIIVLFLIIRGVIKRNEGFEYENKQRNIEDKKIKENNLNWLKSVESGANVYNNTKLYITEKEWLAFIYKNKFLKVTQLYGVISIDKTIMKPYVKCSVYGSCNNYTAIFYIKKTGLEKETDIYFCQNKMDDQDLIQIKSFFESTKENRSSYNSNDMLSPTMIAFYRNMLGLKLQFTHAELKTAYRESVVKYHPDTYGASSTRDRQNAETLMKQINEAYEFLKKIAG